MVFSNLFFLYFVFAAQFDLLFSGEKHPCEKRDINCLFRSFFYAWGEPRYVPLLVGMVLINWIFGLMIEKYRGQKLAKAGLIGACICSLTLLGIFKYLTLILGTTHDLFGLPSVVPQILLPIGISFYTFQLLSYVVDVYRGEVEAQTHFFPSASLYQPVSSVYRRTDRSVQGYFRGNLISADQPGRGGPGNQPVCGGLGEESGAGQYLRAFGRSVYSDGCRCGGCVPVHPERRGPFRKAGGDSLDGRAVLHASNLFGFFRLFRYGHRYGLDDRLPLQGKL